MEDKIKSDFFSRVIKGKPGECWGWSGSTLGRPRRALLYINGVRHYAAHISMEIHGIDIPDNLYACHWCNNPMCTNPQHLYAATNVDNIRYTAYCRRVHGQELTHCKRGHPFSEDNIIITSIGGRKCKECNRQTKLKWNNANRHKRSEYQRKYRITAKQYDAGRK